MGVGLMHAKSCISFEGFANGEAALAYGETVFANGEVRDLQSIGIVWECSR